MFKKFRKYIENRQKGPKIKQEYLNAQGNLVDKAKVKLVADYDGPDAKAPEGKNASPYRPANADAKAQKGENGFADEGDKKLVYEPDVKGGDSKMSALGKELGGDWPKSKMEGFLNKTRKMNSKEFVGYMLGELYGECSCDNLPQVNAPEAGMFHPHPSEAIRYVAALAHQNNKMVENFVHEIRRNGDLGRLLKAMLEHGETYNALVKLFEGEEGATRAKTFAKAMNEAVGPPLGIDDEDEENPKPELDDEGNPVSPEGEEMPPENGEEPELDDEGNPVSPEGEEMPPENGEEPELDDEGNPIEPTGDPLADDDNPAPPAMKKKAHHNLMKSFENFRLK